jgi:TrmH family RNA methyltransferase
VTAFDLALVRALRAREERKRTGLYAIEGVRFLVAAADARAEFVGIAVCAKLFTSAVGQMIVRRLRKAGVPVVRIDEAEYASITRLTEGTGRGVIAVLRQRWRVPERIGPHDLWLAVEAVRSPGNLGTLLRTCLGVGARGVIAVGESAPEQSADVYDPACVRATMGALEALELARMTPDALVRLVRRSRAQLVGASPDGGHDFRRARYSGAVVLLVGCERTGLTESMRSACDVLVRIPMAGGIDSLNVAVAGSLLLYEAFSRR